MSYSIFLYLIIGLAVIIAAALVYGKKRQRSTRLEMHAGLEEARRGLKAASYDVKELNGLPAPVQRYFLRTLQDGQAKVVAVDMKQSGTFNMSETTDTWKAFVATQRVITHRPGFDWEAQIQVAPLLAAHVHDAYIAEEGILEASLFGLVPLASLRGTPEAAEGELMRFLAEAAWYPTALLPGNGLRWEGVDDTSARATLEDGKTTVTLLFRFNENNLIDSVRAEARPRRVGDKMIPTAWEGRWSNYKIQDGMYVPLEGEVAWILPEGSRPYWRGTVKHLSYEFAAHSPE